LSCAGETAEGSPQPLLPEWVLLPAGEGGFGMSRPPFNLK
jgi:hypothetical protein